MNTRTRLVSLAALLVLVACTAGGGGRQGGAPTTAPSTGGPPAVAIPHVTPGGAPTLRAAIAKLCVPPGQTSGTATGSGSLPPDVVAIAHQVERARGHTFTHLPPATAVSDQEMNRRLLKSFSSTYPRSVYDRRTVAWRTIGVIGPGDDLYRAYRSFATGQVVGYYDPETGELVYRSSGDLGFSERFTLAHELTHALDDQTFDLTRLDPLERALPRRTGRGSARARGGQRPVLRGGRGRRGPVDRPLRPVAGAGAVRERRQPAAGRAAVRVRPGALALHGGGGVRRLARRRRHGGCGPRLRAPSGLDRADHRSLDATRRTARSRCRSRTWPATSGPGGATSTR